MSVFFFERGSRGVLRGGWMGRGRSWLARGLS